MTEQLNPGGGWRERYRVRISFIFGLIFIFRAQPRVLFLLIFGMTLSFLGMLLRQWSAGCVKKMDELAMTGPYAIVRHPLYLGSFLAGLGLVLSASSFSLSISKFYFDRTLLFWCLLWILIDSVYIPKIRKEEENLKIKFSDQYEQYVKAVPLLIPNRLKLSSFDFSSFRLELWLKNKEYGGLLGYFAICVVLIFRYLYR